MTKSVVKMNKIVKFLSFRILVSFFFIRFTGWGHAKGLNPSHDRFNKKA